MIHEPMQPIRMGILSDLAPTVEAFMATYLAHYNNSPIGARMLESYTRAWGMSHMVMFPRVEGGRPGFVLLGWVEGDVKKVLIGIEGTTERTSWWNRASGTLGSLTVGALPGRYWGTAVTYANEIKALIDANPVWQSIFFGANTCVEFAGFSLGAGIAEVLAYVYKAANPARQIFLYKFGAGRFGNVRWNNGRNSRVPVVNVYYHRDPVHYMPCVGTRMSFSEGILSNPIAESYARDTVVTRYDLQSVPHGEYSSTFIGGDVGTVAAYYQTMDETNPWFFHDRNQYRYMFCQLCYLGNEVLFHRLGFLEHNDENTWQLNFRPGRGVQPDMLVLSAPEPDDQFAATPSVIAATQSPPPAQTVLPQASFAWQGGGEDWDAVGNVPVVTRQRRPGRTRRIGSI